MTSSTGPGDPPGAAPQPSPGTAAPEVEVLLHDLDGLARRPLAEQVELLDGVRRGLDDVLARPARDAG